MTRKYKYTGKQSNGEKKPEGYTFGRPTTYKKEYCEMLIAHMAEGFSFESFSAIVDTHRGYIYEWVKKYPDFAEAKKFGSEKSAIWWEKLHRRCAATGEGNMTGIIWAQKNKWPKQYYERPAKIDSKILLQHNQNLNASVNGDFKTLVATMTAEQMGALIGAIENRTIELESSENKEKE